MSRLAKLKESLIIKCKHTKMLMNFIHIQTNLRLCSSKLYYLRLHVHSCVATPHSVLRFLPVGSWRRSLHAVQHSLLYHEQQASGCHDHGERQHRRHDGGVSSHGGRAHGWSEVDQGSARSFNPVLLLARRHSESHALKSPSVCRGSVTRYTDIPSEIDQHTSIASVKQPTHLTSDRALEKKKLSCTMGVGWHSDFRGN